MRIRFVAATSIALVGVVACSSVINGKGSAGTSGPIPPGSLGPIGSISPSTPPSPSNPTPSPSTSTSIPGFPSSSSTTATTFSSSIAIPTPTVTPPTGQVDFKCPYIVYPYAHLSFVCVASKMKKTTKAKPWPVAWRQVVSRYGNNGEWTLDTGAGHWGSQGTDTLRQIAQRVRTQMIDNGNYGNPAPAVRDRGKQIEVSGHRAFQLVSTFTINRTFRNQTGVKIKHEKSWILAIEVAPGDVSMWYVSVPDAVKYYWGAMASLISTISVD